MKLNLKPNLARPDAFYEKLLQAHDGLSAEQSAALNARLILTLANHVGDEQALEEAIAVAKGSA